jgi:hypothetical protein
MVRSRIGRKVGFKTRICTVCERNLEAKDDEWSASKYCAKSESLIGRK